MAKVTSKLQVTIPKAIAEKYSIEPGDEIEWVPGDESVRVVPAKTLKRGLEPAARLRLFDGSTERQRQREALAPRAQSNQRGWSRAELYERGRSG